MSSDKQERTLEQTWEQQREEQQADAINGILGEGPNQQGARKEMQGYSPSHSDSQS